MPADILPSVRLPDNAMVPALGLGTWKMGETARRSARESAALALGLDLGMTLVDTAEMYADGRAEEIVADALAGRRDDAFVVSKVYPHNAGRANAIAACERSLRRLRTDRIDLYLLHWRGDVPLAETVAAFVRLQREGKIVRWGVSNFDTADMCELWTVPGGRDCATNQVLYHLRERNIEWALLPWMRAHGVPLMAYSPLGQGALARDRKLAAVAATMTLGGAAPSPAQVALAWAIRQGDVIAIPQSTDAAHLRANRDAAGLVLDPDALAALDNAFPPPTRDAPLATL